MRASVRFLALSLHRLLQAKLCEAKSALSPARALGLLGRIQHRQLKSGGRLHESATPLTGEQGELLDVFGAEKPMLPA